MSNFLPISFIVSVQDRIFPLNMCNIIIYVARWWKKYLSKPSLIKHTCSWCDKLVVLWTLNRQAKIFLHILTFGNHFFTYSVCTQHAAPKMTSASMSHPKLVLYEIRDKVNLWLFLTDLLQILKKKYLPRKWNAVIIMVFLGSFWYYFWWFFRWFIFLVIFKSQKKLKMLLSQKKTTTKQNKTKQTDWSKLEIWDMFLVTRLFSKSIFPFLRYLIKIWLGPANMSFPVKFT